MSARALTGERQKSTMPTKRKRGDGDGAGDGDDDLEPTVKNAAQRL